jgi:hypothetical protein
MDAADPEQRLIVSRERGLSLERDVSVKAIALRGNVMPAHSRVQQPPQFQAARAARRNGQCARFNA